MAALKAFCLSSAPNAPVFTSALFARHRLLTTTVSNQRMKIVPRLGRALSSNPGDELCGFSGLEEHQVEENAVAVVNSQTVSDPVTIECVETNKLPVDNFASKLQFLDFVTLASEEEDQIQAPDMVKPRGSFLRQQNKDILFQRLPTPSQSTLQFTVGRQITTLDNAKSAVRRVKPPLDELLMEDETKLISVNHEKLRSRTASQSENTRDVVNYVTTRESMYKQDLHLYTDALPSILGSNVSEIEETREKLSQAGFSPAEIGRVLPIIPLVFEVDYEKVYKVYCLLMKYLCHQTRVLKLMRTHTFLLTLDPSQVMNTLERYSSFGLSSPELLSLLTHYPLVFTTPLKASTLSRIRQTMESGLDSHWLAKTLLYSMRYRPAQAEFDPTDSLTIDLLKEYKVDLGDVLIKHPDLFQQSGEQLLVLIKTLSGGPLYLNKGDIGSLLSKIPEVLFQLNDMDALRAHLSLLAEIFTAYTLRNQLFSVKHLLDYRYDVASKLRSLASHSLTREDACTLITNSPSLILQGDLGEKLGLMLNIPGVTVRQIAESSKMLLQQPLPYMQARIKFATQHKEPLVGADHVQELLTTTDQAFAELCGCTVRQYLSSTGLAPLTPKRGRPIKGAHTLRPTNQYEPNPNYKFTGAVTLDSIFNQETRNSELSTLPSPREHCQTSPPEAINNLSNVDELSTSFGDCYTESLNTPDDLVNVTLSPESIPYENSEDSKRESDEIFYSNLGLDMEEFLRELRAASHKKDPLFDRGVLNTATVPRETEFLDEHLFWEYEECDEQFDVQAI